MHQPQDPVVAPQEQFPHAIAQEEDVDFHACRISREDVENDEAQCFNCNEQLKVNQPVVSIADEPHCVKCSLFFIEEQIKERVRTVQRLQVMKRWAQSIGG